MQSKISYISLVNKLEAYNQKKCGRRQAARKEPDVYFYF
jgi:hypothetical protein